MENEERHRNVSFFVFLRQDFVAFAFRDGRLLLAMSYSDPSLVFVLPSAGDVLVPSAGDVEPGICRFVLPLRLERSVWIRLAEKVASVRSSVVNVYVCASWS